MKGQDTSALATAELFDPATGAWSQTGSLRQARRVDSAVRLLDGRVLVAGGSGEGFTNRAMPVKC